MMPWNEEGSRTELFWAWVPCVDYTREREKQKSTIKKLYHKGNEKVRMHEQCMII